MDNLKAFIKAAEAIQRECESTSYEDCNNNNCKYATEDGYCIFIRAYLEDPHNWELHKLKEKEA